MFNVTQMDYTKKEAVEWYNRIIKKSVDMGFSGFMADFGKNNPLHLY